MMCITPGHNRHLLLLAHSAAIALLACALTTNGHAKQKTKTSSSKPHTEITQEAKSKKTAVKQRKSSAEESPAERDRRLKRECKGRHNAGACLGYTRD